MILKFTVDNNDSGKTVKYILKNRLELSERLIKKLKYQNKILCNKQPVFVPAVVSTGDVIEVDIDFDEEKLEEIVPQDLSIDVIFEDDSLIVINKTPNIVVHPTCAHPDGTLANAVAFHLMKNGVTKKIRPVIRLDRDTSGIIIFAKNSFSQEFLIRQMNKKTFVKEYIGIVHGTLKKAAGTIDLPIERKNESIMLRHVSPSGDRSVTHFETLENLTNASLLKFRLETGRTHQIRVHCQAIGHPLIGDTLYPYIDISHSAEVFEHIAGDTVYYKTNDIISKDATPITHRPKSPVELDIIGRQALHSYKVEFIHPINKKSLQITAPIPPDIENALEILRK